MDYELAKSRLRSAWSMGRMPHALLLSDASGAECSLWSFAAMLLLCDGNGDGVVKPCGVCAACRQLEAGNHADFSLLYDEKAVKIDRVREMMESLSARPLSGRRVIALRRADMMTPQAQNALLKSIEEPFANTFFILTARGAMLPTLRSRVMELRCGSVGGGEVAQALLSGGTAAEEAKLFARVAQGDLERARALALDGGREREAALALAMKVAKGEVFTLDKSLSLDKALDVWETFFRDSLAVGYLGEECAINADKLDAVRFCANNFTIALRQGIMDTIYKAKRRLKSNANQQMTLDFMAAEIGGLSENRG